MSRESYDALPYPAQPFAQSHPRNLEMIATLLGLTPPPIASARVLELGCGTGGNLIPMAATMPNATFVGIDYSPVQIDQARTFAESLALTNIRFEPLSILDLAPDFGQFDYIIAHGLLSWVPRHVQAETFEVMRANLSEHGVAYVSFNVFPGWHARQWMREMMSFHAPEQPWQRAEERVQRARQICDFVLATPDVQNSPAGAMLKKEMEQWANRPAQYVVHEYLDETNHPFYFHQFAAEAERHGLQYLADAQDNAVLFEASKLLDEAGDDIVRREQYWDFLHNTTFRRALLVHAARQVDRKSMHSHLESMFVTSRMTTDAPQSVVTTPQVVQFTTPAGVALNINHPLTKAALMTLQASFPQPMRVNELLDQSTRAAVVPPDERPRSVAQLLRAWSMNLIQLYVTPPDACTRPSSRPEIFAIARQQAANGSRDLTNLRHEVVPIEPPFDQIIPMFDGQRTRERIADEIGTKLPGKFFSNKSVALRATEQLVEHFAKESLLVR